MRTYTCAMLLRFKPEEMAALTEKARKAKMSRESYCRAILNGSTVKEAPTVDTGTLIRDIRRAGNNLNQVLVKANTLGFLDVPMLRSVTAECHTAILHIMEAYKTD